MTTKNYLHDQLIDPKFEDKAPPRRGPHSHRLCLGSSNGPCDWNDIASTIENHPMQWFVDANVVFRPDTEPIWDAFQRLFAVTNDAPALLSEFVLFEMKDWIKEPFRLKERAKAFREALNDRNGWLTGVNFVPDGHTPVFEAFLGYVHLLGLRRQLASPMPNGFTAFGPLATSKSDVMNAIKDQIGYRALPLAKKGRDDIEQHGRASVNDEAHCLAAIFYALITGRETTILTADYDLYEIFYKAQWFLDVHYKSWMIAKLIQDGEYGEPERIWTDRNGRYFEGDVKLYRQKSVDFHEVLSGDYTAVPVHVMFMDPHGQMYELKFEFEREMGRMLRLKGATRGRCTDLFGDENVYINLGPVTRDVGGGYIGVGRDVLITGQEKGIEFGFSRLDGAHSIHCKERHVNRGSAAG